MATAELPTTDLSESPAATTSLGLPPALPSENQPGASIFDKAVCLSVELRKPTNLRAADLDQITTVEGKQMADRDMLTMGKKLLDCPEVRNIAKVDAKIRKLLKQRCLPSPLRSGVYLLPLDLLDEVDAKLTELIAQRQAAVDELVAAYPTRVAEAKDRLKDQFQIADYPPEETLKQSYSVVTSYLTFGVPGSLLGINKAVYERAKAQANAKWEEASEQIQLALRQGMQELVAHLVERLTPGEDGKKKLFMSSTLENTLDFLNTFKSRNLTNDGELDGLVTQAQQLLSGVEIDKLRKDELFRGELREQFSAMQATLDGMVVSAPVRVFRFDEEE